MIRKPILVQIGYMEQTLKNLMVKEWILMKVLKKSFALILAACIFSVTSGILSVSAGASKVQYYKTVGDIFDADYLIDEQHEEEQRIGSSASIPLGLAGIDTKDKKVGDGSFFQKALTANNGMSAWICGDKKWNGKGYVDASGASRPGFVMWFYISDVNKMAIGTEGAAKDVFFKVRLGSDADKSLSRNDSIYYSMWFTKENIQTGWNYLVVDLKKDYTPGQSYKSSVDGVECEVTTGEKARVDFSKIDWIVFDIVAGGSMTWKMDYVQIVDLAVKQNGPTEPTPAETTSKPGNASTTSTATVSRTNSNTAVNSNSDKSSAPAGNTSRANTDSQTTDVSGEIITNSDSPIDMNSAQDGAVSETNTNSQQNKSDKDTALDGESNNSNAGLIAGIIILVVAVLGGGAAAVYFLVIKKKQN